MGEAVKRTRVDEESLERLLGLESSKIGFYAEVKQKIHELEPANMGLRNKSYELQAVFEAIPDLFFRLDARGIILDYYAGRQAQLGSFPGGDIGS